MSLIIEPGLEISDAQIEEKIGHLTHERAECVTEARSILAKAEREKRDLSIDEEARSSNLLDAAERLAEQIAKYRRSLGGSVQGKSELVGSNGPEARSFQPGEFRALAKDESFREHLIGTGEVAERRGRPLSLGKTIVGLVTGRWDGAADERRALSGSSDVAGGYLLGEELSSLWIDKARAASVMVRAGVKVVPMRTASLAMLRVTGDPTPSWRIEGSPIATSEPTFGSATLNARSLAVAVPISKELLADAANAADIVESVLVSAMALEFDRAVLDGDGVVKPKGIRNTTGVGTLAVSGAASTLKFAEAIGTVLQQNETPNGIVLHPRTYSAAIDRAVDSTNQPLRLPPSLERMPFYQTTSVPTNLGGGTDTAPVVGDFSQVVVGLRQNVEIAISTQGSTSDGRGFPRNEAIIVAILRADSMLIREKAFCVMTGVTN
ncbi:MAG: phage major capsid protein [Phycisphaerales bacterium]|nr:phage major capsid protein [Phycisphaerales bacterium]